MSVYHDYFCTVGSGLEHFCSTELLSLGLTNISEVSEGKVFFSSSLPVHKLLSLRIPERLFLLVYREPQFLISHPKRKAILILRDAIECKSCSKLEHSLQKWREFHCSFKCLNLNELSFRVSCKSHGEIKRVFPPAFLGKIIAGSLLNIRRTWSTDLRNPQLEFLVHAKKDTFIVGIACCLMNSPLSKRPYLASTRSCTSLRPTVCSALINCGLSIYEKHPLFMAGMKKVRSPLSKKQHLVILDPMCGSGMILAEAVSFLRNKNITLLGSDINKFQVETASRHVLNAENHSKNMKDSDEGSSCNRCFSSLFVADARALPLKDNSVDIIISDVPFGLKHYTYPWKKESSECGINENTSESNECHWQEPAHCGQVDGDIIPLQSCGRETQEIAPLIKLDLTMDNYAKGGDSNQECLTKIDASEEVICPPKKRKLEDKEIKQSIGVNSTRNMLPNLVKELDRVLKGGGQSVLLISENLKTNLVSVVSKVTKVDCVSTAPEYLSETNKSSITNVTTVITTRPAEEEIATTNNDEINKGVSTKSQYEWLLVEQHPIKLGILKAVICVFSKQCMNN